MYELLGIMYMIFSCCSVLGQFPRKLGDSRGEILPPQSTHTSQLEIRMLQTQRIRPHVRLSEEVIFRSYQRKCSVPGSRVIQAL